MPVDSDSVQKTVSAVEGQTVSLPCEATNDETIRVVEWTRPDLKDQPVLLYRDGHFDPDNHPSYRNRVDLKDVKDGDVSLILKNVTFNDRGTFECYVIQGGEQSRKKRSEDTESLSLVSLSVFPPPGDPGGRGGDGGHVGLIVGVTVAALVVVGVVMLQRYLKNQVVSETLTAGCGLSVFRGGDAGDPGGQTGL
ncbi:coxsackievirus and adenovirus receptor homolog [Salarias fasciatus]|uniref:coxsackievirus and adenovirus receptor homolog n=1 Tax=Salarias fasciatus TaxID=181472 RepID=UPI0011768644|nr:coxsackievirus and adenovirus receptor homolog [Salarias fasciatus]